MNSDIPNQRFVKLRLDNQTDDFQYMTFLLEAIGNSNPEDNPIIISMKEKDPQKAAYATKILSYLAKNDAKFIDWIESSATNVALFAKDPLKALQEVYPNLPKEYST